MERVKLQITSGKLTDPDLLGEATDSYATAKVELVWLEKQREDTEGIAHEDEARRSYKELMLDVGDA